MDRRLTALYRSTDFSTIQTEAKTAKLQNHPEFPPDLCVFAVSFHFEFVPNLCKSLTNSVQGIAWRLGFGIFNPSQPEGTP